MRFFALAMFLSISYIAPIFSYSSLNKSDPCPMFNCVDPQDFLTSNYRAQFKGMETEYPVPETFSMALNVFMQKANRGRDLEGHKVYLGDLQGRWNVVGLFYDPVVAEKIFSQSYISSDTQGYADCVEFITTPTNADPNQNFGFFQVPVSYKKYGVRFEFNLQITNDIGFRLDLGVVDIKQTASFIDLTSAAYTTSCYGNTPSSGQITCAGEDCCNNTICCIDTYACDCKTFVIKDIMRQFCKVARTIGLDISDFSTTGGEDPILSLYLRHVYDVNTNRQSFPLILFTPFLVVEGTIPIGKLQNYSKAFSLSTGNNGHAGLGFYGGFNVDFVDTVAIGFDAGMMHYFPKEFPCYWFPTNCLQSGIFPVKLPVKISPGTNWRFNAQMAAYHFLDRLSFYVQYSFVTHETDCLEVLQEPPPGQNIIVEQARTLTRWQSQFATSSLYYDISPNITLGLVWQAPISQRNAYRSMTILGSIVATF